MRSKVYRIWPLTVLVSALIFLFSALLTGILAYISMNMGISSRVPRFTSVAAFLIISSAIGLILAAVFSRKFLKPLMRLIEATKRVADGDFSVRVEENGRSEMSELIRNFNRMTRALSHTETVSADFVNNLSHEIRTPISAIENCATLLGSGRLDEQETREYADMIAQNARRLSALSRNVLELSRLDNGARAVSVRAFSLDEQLRRALVSLEDRWTEKRLELELQLSPVSCVSDEEMLMQVWINLLDNAIKFSPQGGRLFLSADEVKGEPRVCVRDYGAGMSEEVQSRVWEKFYQADASHAREGNGLGLPLVKRIIQTLGGRVELESAPGEGSAFTVYLPKKPAAG